MRKNDLITILSFSLINLMAGYSLSLFAVNIYFPADITVIYTDISSIFTTKAIIAAGFLCISLISFLIIFISRKEIAALPAILMTVINVIVFMLVTFCYGKIYFGNDFPAEITNIPFSVFNYYQLLLFTALISPVIQFIILKLTKP
ncbi:hypothetical protein CKG00_09795 [Morganella morganii]|uniref:Uncharacterized protein n=1 Tax=Morganella morganii TaxID=582 RepID=A0A433ZX40_MORMO|nr:hypothetical protein CKG00_09795 [Morganella morganii]